MSPSESPLHQGPYGNPPYMRVPMKVPLIAGVPIRLALYIRVPFRVPPYQDPPYIRCPYQSPHQSPSLHQVSLTESLLHQDPYGNPSYIRVPMKVPLISSVPIRLALYIREGPHQRPPISGSPLHQVTLSESSSKSLLTSGVPIRVLIKVAPYI
ncbi:hypothetical protein AB205_0194870, partial [Aquarana catesbeiana]